MSTYLIDYENVKNDGLVGIDSLFKEDLVYIFYSKNVNTMTFETHQKLLDSKAKVEFVESILPARTSKNYLDFQLATFAGYLVCSNRENSYVIVTKDKGFDAIIDFLKNEKRFGKVNIKKTTKIKSEVVSKPKKIVIKKPLKTEPKKVETPKALDIVTKKIVEVKTNVEKPVVIKAVEAEVVSKPTNVTEKQKLQKLQVVHVDSKHSIKREMEHVKTNNNGNKIMHIENSKPTNKVVTEIQKEAIPKQEVKIPVSKNNVNNKNKTNKPNKKKHPVVKTTSTSNKNNPVITKTDKLVTIDFSSKKKKEPTEVLKTTEPKKVLTKLKEEHKKELKPILRKLKFAPAQYAAIYRMIIRSYGTDNPKNGVYVLLVKAYSQGRGGLTYEAIKPVLKKIFSTN